MLTKTKFSHLRAKTAGAGAVGDHESEDPPEVAVLMPADTKRRCLLWQPEPSEHTARGAAQRQLQDIHEEQKWRPGAPSEAFNDVPGPGPGTASAVTPRSPSPTESESVTVRESAVGLGTWYCGCHDCMSNLIHWLSSCNAFLTVCRVPRRSGVLSTLCCAVAHLEADVCRFHLVSRRKIRKLLPKQQATGTYQAVGLRWKSRKRLCYLKLVRRIQIKLH